jgi:FXSXX-COOH protein
VDEVTLPSADARDDDELPIPLLHDAALSDVLNSDIGDTALGHSLRRLLNDLNHPEEAISAFGNVVQ